MPSVDNFLLVPGVGLPVLNIPMQQFNAGNGPQVQAHIPVGRHYFAQHFEVVPVIIKKNYASGTSIE